MDSKRPWFSFRLTDRSPLEFCQFWTIMFLPNLFSNSYSDLELSNSSCLDAILVGSCLVQFMLIFLKVTAFPGTVTRCHKSEAVVTGTSLMAQQSLSAFSTKGIIILQTPVLYNSQLVACSIFSRSSQTFKGWQWESKRVMFSFSHPMSLAN